MGGGGGVGGVGRAVQIVIKAGLTLIAGAIVVAFVSDPMVDAVCLLLRHLPAPSQMQGRNECEYANVLFSPKLRIWG